MSRYPAKKPLIDGLAEVARRAAMDSTATHPDDIASVMATAIECAAIAFMIAHERSATV